MYQVSVAIFAIFASCLDMEVSTVDHLVWEELILQPLISLTCQTCTITGWLK